MCVDGRREIVIMVHAKLVSTYNRIGTKPMNSFYTYQSVALQPLNFACVRVGHLRSIHRSGTAPIHAGFYHFIVTGQIRQDYSGHHIPILLVLFICHSSNVVATALALCPFSLKWHLTTVGFQNCSSWVFLLTGCKLR